MIRGSYTLILLLIVQLCMAQIQVGYYHDLDGLPIHDFVDPFQYSPNEQLKLTHYSDSYERGSVYFPDGNVSKGYIRFENKKIWFKETRNGEKQKIKPEETKALTIGLDSFFVANNFKVEKHVGPHTQEQPQFMQYLTSFDGKVYAKHYFFSSGMAQSYTMASAVIETYQVRNEGDNVWMSFPRNSKRFKPIALKYFGHVPYLKRKIEDGSIGYEDMITLIRSAEYYNKWKTSDALFFDRYWNESDEANGMYRASIVSLENDSIWTIDYFKGQTPLYRVKYHSLFPNKKHGFFEILNDQGLPVSTITYSENDIIEKAILHPDGKPHYIYRYKEMSPGYNPYTRVNYEGVYDTSGESISRQGEWTEQVRWKQGDFTNEFDGERLINSFREKDGLEIHQITDPDYKFKTKRLQSLLDTYFEESNLHGPVEENVQGTYFISLVISDKGTITNYKVHNSLHPTIDSKIRSWARMYLDGPYAVKFKPYKVAKEKVHAEFLIPLQFNILKFYRKPANYYYDWNMHHQMMFHQQMMQPVNLPTPPPMPARF